MAKLADRHPLRLWQGWTSFSEHEVVAEYFQHHLPTLAISRLLTRTPAASGVSASKIWPTDRHFSSTVTSTDKIWLALPHPFKTQDGELPIRLSRLVLESSLNTRLKVHEKKPAVSK